MTSETESMLTEQERIERFEAAYNRIDHALAELVGESPSLRRRTFAARVRSAVHRRRQFARFADFLFEIGELRNALIHNRRGDDDYIAVPSEQTVLELEHIEQAMFSPPRVIPRFACSVVSLQANQSLADVFRLVRNDGHSRYPVYENGGFIGLLTSNGVARWLARQGANGAFSVNLDRVLVGDVLQADHRRNAVAFLSRDSAIDEADQLFIDQPNLEAILITEHGKPSQKPLGLISAGDIVNARQR
jgi:predicted transcriptional regulator